MTGKLQPSQLAALLEAEEDNIQKGRYLSDHMTSNASGVLGSDVGPSWLKVLGDLSDYLIKNVNVQLNFGTLDGIGVGAKRRTLDSQGFPVWAQVKYTLSAPGTYVPWVRDDDREITQIVLHSFGQQWHAYEANGKWLGPMNEPGGSDGYLYINDGVEELIWIPKGSDPDRGFAQWDRFTSSLQSLIHAPQGVTGVHFVIDRAGNLYVMGDCNDVMGSSGDLSDTCISIGLEEALYARAEEDGFRARPATWLPGGDPPGTEGNLTYWDYSVFQYITLATLVRKLQNAIPSLKTTEHSTSPRSVDSSFVGFTMHSHVTDAPNYVTDVSPHFQTEEEWEQFFELVTKQAAVDEYATWQKVKAGPSGNLAWVEPVVSALGPEAAGILEDASANPAIHTLLGVHRAHQEISKSSTDYRESAASLMFNDSKLQKQKEGVGKIVEVSMSAPTVYPTNDPLAEDVSLEDSRSTGVDTEGLY